MAEPADAPAHMWFVKTGGEVWGPYPQDRVAAFAHEGRVRPSTLLSPFPKGPWAPAADTDEFADALRPVRVEASTTIPAGRAPLLPRHPPLEREVAPLEPYDAQVVRPIIAAPAPAPAAAPAVAPTGPERAMLVFAELTSVAPAAFQAALGRLGRCVQVRPGLWLLRASLGASGLRNMLSSRLTASDALLVVEAPIDQAAWFNLAPSSDRELRRLWAGG